MLTETKLLITNLNYIKQLNHKKIFNYFYITGYTVRKKSRNYQIYKIHYKFIYFTENTKMGGFWTFGSLKMNIYTPNLYMKYKIMNQIYRGLFLKSIHDKNRLVLVT